MKNPRTHILLIALVLVAALTEPSALAAPAAQDKSAQKATQAAPQAPA